MTAHGQILVVCTGNVCRSPYIERRLQLGLDQRWGAGVVRVRSAGTGSLAGQPMDPRSAGRLHAAGGDAAGFEARQLAREMVAEADLVLGATRDHRRLVAQLHPRALRYAFALNDFADLAGHLTPGDLPSTEDGPTWVREITATIAAHRGLTSPLEPAAADIVDPYRRSDDVYAEMARQIDAVLPRTLWALGVTEPATR